MNTGKLGAQAQNRSSRCRVASTERLFIGWVEHHRKTKLWVEVGLDTHDAVDSGIIFPCPNAGGAGEGDSGFHMEGRTTGHDAV